MSSEKTFMDFYPLDQVFDPHEILSAVSAVRRSMCPSTALTPKAPGTISTGPRGVGDEGSLASCPPEASWDGNGTSELDWGHSFPTLDWHFLKGEFEFIQKNMVSWGKIVWRTWSSGWNGLFSHSLGWPSFKSHYHRVGDGLWFWVYQIVTKTKTTLDSIERNPVLTQMSHSKNDVSPYVLRLSCLMLPSFSP